MESIQLMDDAARPSGRAPDPVGHQAAAHLLELSHDWAIRRISRNCDSLLGRDSAVLVGMPLGEVVPSQALHDLRNLFSRVSANTGIARAFAVHLFDHHAAVDIAFQLDDGRVLLEAVPSASAFGVAFGSVGGLMASFAGTSGAALREGAARRMRALTGHDRVTLTVDGERWTNGRAPGPANAGKIPVGCPPIVSDCEAAPVTVLPDTGQPGPPTTALLRAPDAASVEALRGAGTRSLLRIPFERGEFVCECSRPRAPSFELHAAAELFAQMFALRLQADRLA